MAPEKSSGSTELNMGSVNRIKDFLAEVNRKEQQWEMFFNFVFKGMLVFVYHYPVMSQLQPCFLELCCILPV